MSVTIRDVAKRLNKSITTVSRALDGYPDVAQETRQLVVRTAQEMGYVPNRAARQLRRQRTDTIGYILPTLTPQFADPFFSEFIAGLGDEAALNNFDLLVSTAPSGTEVEYSRYQKWAFGKKVSGFVLNRMHQYDWRVQYLVRQGIPYVSLESSLDQENSAYVEVDSVGGFKKLISYLVGKGHKRIAYIGASSDLKIQLDRFAGYQEGLAGACIPFDPELIIDGNLSRLGGYNASQKLLELKEVPTAITCINDLTAIGVLHAAHERGFKVGQTLAVTGFDGIDEVEHTLPPLTTLKQPVYDIARRLVKMLVTMINGELLNERQVRLQPELIIRESTG
jgi:LacI family transcriptional regulator